MSTYHKSDVGIRICDSYQIKSGKEMQEVLNEIRTDDNNQSQILQKRTDKSLIEEWKAHNLLYYLHLFRSHTADVDFEYPQKWYYKVIYKILSFFWFR